MSTSSQFKCKCGKFKGWITEGEETKPCPNCGRVYVGYYDKKNLTISGLEKPRLIGKVLREAD